jgi:hypothetical protein
MSACAILEGSVVADEQRQGGPPDARHDHSAGQAPEYGCGVLDPLLSSVSVFDSRTANVHVDQTNDVAYTPFPMKVLGDLVQTCQEIKQRINGEIAALD